MYSHIHNQGHAVIQTRKNSLRGKPKGVVGMWKFNLTKKTPPTPPQKCLPNNNITTKRTKPDLAQWYHATIFIPEKQILLK